MLLQDTTTIQMLWKQPSDKASSFDPTINEDQRRSHIHHLFKELFLLGSKAGTNAAFRRLNGTKDIKGLPSQSGAGASFMDLGLALSLHEWMY